MIDFFQPPKNRRKSKSWDFDKARPTDGPPVFVALGFQTPGEEVFGPQKHT